MRTTSRRKQQQARPPQRRLLTAVIALSIAATSFAATIVAPATASAGDLPDLPGFVSLTSRAGVPAGWGNYPVMWGGHFIKKAVAGESSMSNDGERFAIIVPGTVGQTENDPGTPVTQVAVYEPRRSNALTALAYPPSEGEAALHFTDPQISLDGDHVVAVTRWGSEAKIVKWTFDNGAWGAGSVLDEGACGIWMPRISEDGSTIAYMKGVSTGDGCANHLVVHGAGSNADRIVAHDSNTVEFSASIGSYQLSGDGRWIFWNQIEGETSEVWARDLEEGTSDIELGFDLGSADGVSVWSIDASDYGRHVLIEGAADGQLWVFDRDSNNDGTLGDINEMQITDFKSSNDSRPAMSGSGNFVVWTRFSSGTCVVNERAQPLNGESSVVVWSQTAKQPNNTYGPGIVDQGVERYAEDGDGTTCSRDVLIDWSGERIHWFDTAAHLTLGGTSDNNGLVNLYEFRNSYGYFLWGRRLFGGHRNVEDVADPVSTTLGNFYHTVSDLNAGGYGMSLERTYNAMDDRSSDFGYGWSNTFGQELRDLDEYGTALIMGDGRWVIFPLDPNGSGHVRPQDLAGTLDVSAPSSPKVRFDSGEVWTFDVDGRLMAMADGQGETVTVARTAGALQSAVSSTGSRIDFTDANFDKRVDKAEVKPAGAATATQQVDFTYQSATVGAVTHPTLASASAPYSNPSEPRSKEQYNLDAASGQITQIDLVGINYPAPTSVRKVSQTFRGDGRVDTQTTQDGSVMTFAYDDRALTTTVTDGASGDVNTYHYDADTGYTTTITDATGNSNAAASEYEVHGLLTQSSDRGGARSALHYDTAGRIAQEVRSDPDTGFIPLAAGGTGCVRNPDGSFPAPDAGACADKHHSITSYTYAGSTTRIASTTDPDGVVTSYEYDTTGHPSATRPVRTTIGTGPGALVSYVGLNADNQAVATQDGDGVTTCRYLDTNGRVSSELKILVATEAPVTTSMTPAQVSSNLVATCTAHVNDTSNKVGRTSYTYTSAGHLATKVTPELQGTGQSWSYTYWGSGQLKTETDPLGATTSYSYGLTGEQTVTDPLGAVTTSTREWNVTGPRCGTKPDSTPRSVCSVATSTGPMHTTTMVVDSTTTITVDQVSEDVYDAAGDLVEHRDPASKLGDPKPTTKYEYGPMARLLKQINPDGTVTQYRYDTDGRRTATILGTNPNDVAATEFTEYDKLGRVKKTTSRSDGPTSPATVTEHTYTKGGKNLTTIVGPAPGNPGAPIVTENEYDSNTGQLRTTKLVRDDYADANQPDGKARQSTTRSYTPGGRVSCVDTVTEAPAGGAAKRRFQVRMYDDAGRERFSAVPWTGNSDLVGLVTSCTDRMTVVTNPATSRSYYAPNKSYWIVSAKSYRRDDTLAGEQSLHQHLTHGVTNPWDIPDNNPSFQTSYGYDAAGRRTTVSTPVPQNPLSVTRTCYTPRGEAYMTIDPYGHAVHTSFYDQPGLAKAVTDPIGMPAGATCASVPTDATGKKGTTTFTYDGRGNKLSATKWNETLGAGAFVTERWNYTGAGELASYTRPIDATTTLTDSFGSTVVNGRTATRWSQTGDAADQSLRRTTDTMDKTGKVRSSDSLLYATSEHTIVDRAYDFAGRTASVTENPGAGQKTLGYEYNTAGNVTAVVYPDTKRLEVAWNLAGNRTQVKNPDGAISRYTYDDRGQVRKVSVVVNGIPVPVTTHAMTLDGEIGTTTFGATTSYRKWTYNTITGMLSAYTQDVDSKQATWLVGRRPDGRVAAEACTTTNSTWCSVHGGTGNRRTDYTYDRAGQLTSATVTGATTGEISKWAYTYANQGTRTTQTVTTVGQATPATTTYVYNHANQLTAATGAGNGVGTYTYDRAGRRLVADRTATGGNGTKQTTAYDPRGLSRTLTTERTGQTTEVETRTYDAEGRYHQFATTGPATHTGTMYWDPTTGGIPQIGQLTIDGSVKQYTFGADRITNGTTYNSYDIHGSNLTSPNNPATTGYTPYGESATSAADHTFNYRGELSDAGLIHLRARDYDPIVGTFTSRDPLSGVSGTSVVANAYHYSDNDPINAADPTGMRPKDDPLMELFAGWTWRESFDECHARQSQSRGGLTTTRTTQSGSDCASTTVGPRLRDIQFTCSYTGKASCIRDILLAHGFPAHRTSEIYKWFCTGNGNLTGNCDIGGALRDHEAEFFLIDLPASFLVSGISALIPRSGASLVGASGQRMVLIDTNMVLDRSGVEALLAAGETPVITQATRAELNNLVAAGRIRMPAYASELQVIDDSMNVHLRINIRSGINSTKPGLAGDGMIGATAVERGLPIITRDRNFAKFLEYLGVEVRRPG